MSSFSPRSFTAFILTDKHKQNALSKTYTPTIERRQLSIGGLTLGGPDGGISGGGLKVGGKGGKNSTAAAGAAAPKASKPATGIADLLAAAEGTAKPKPASSGGAGTESQPGRAEGDAARAQAEGEAAAAKGEKPAAAAKGEKSEGVKATQEAEQFSEEAGITLAKDGSAQNLGGDLGITKGTDGSTSVGGKSGINIAADGTAKLKGNE